MARARETVLFLCTGNYYRSRFAEMLFNHLAVESQLNWKADSRGIATILGADNSDVISVDRTVIIRVHRRESLGEINPNEKDFPSQFTCGRCASTTTRIDRASPPIKGKRPSFGVSVSQGLRRGEAPSTRYGVV